MFGPFVAGGRDDDVGERLPCCGRILGLQAVNVYCVHRMQGIRGEEDPGDGQRLAQLVGGENGCDDISECGRCRYGTQDAVDCRDDGRKAAGDARLGCGCVVALGLDDGERLTAWCEHGLVPCQAELHARLGEQSGVLGLRIISHCVTCGVRGE